MAEDENQAPDADDQSQGGGAPPQPEEPKKGAFEDWRLACAAAIGATVALFANPFGKQESAQQKEERERALGPRPLWPVWRRHRLRGGLRARRALDHLPSAPRRLDR